MDTNAECVACGLIFAKYQSLPVDSKQNTIPIDKKEIVTNIFNFLSVVGIFSVSVFLFYLMPIIHVKFRIFLEHEYLWFLFYPVFLIVCFLIVGLIVWLGKKFILFRIIAWLDKQDNLRKNS